MTGAREVLNAETGEIKNTEDQETSPFSQRVLGELCVPPLQNLGKSFAFLNAAN